MVGMILSDHNERVKGMLYHCLNETCNNKVALIPQFKQLEVWERIKAVSNLPTYKERRDSSQQKPEGLKRKSQKGRKRDQKKRRKVRQVVKNNAKKQKEKDK